MKKIESILLIDDDQDDQYFFHKALQSTGNEIELFTANNGREALDKLRFIKPELILLDMVMPVMGGVAFLKAIKADPLLNYIPVVIYTTSWSVFKKAEVLKLGAEEVYFKPESFEETVSVLNEILQKAVHKKSA
jgi:CheY-like chemotaxis protein